MLADANCNSYIYIYIYTLSLIASQYAGIHQIEPVLLSVPLAIYTLQRLSVGVSNEWVSCARRMMPADAPSHAIQAWDSLDFPGILFPPQYPKRNSLGTGKVLNLLH